MKQTVILFALLALVSIYFDYPAMYDELPMSAHQWRQSDGASIALNYYQNGMNFLQPQFHHLMGGNGYSVGEFPGLYYLAAVLYHIFGPEEGLFRLLSFLVFAFGLLALSKVILKTTGDELLSYAIPLLLMSSPVVAFYAFNFLPNTPALGLVFVGWYFFHRYYESQKIGALYWSCLFFALGGLLKVTALFTFLPILAVWFFELVGISKFKGEKHLFQSRWTAVIPFLMTIGIVAAWYIFAMKYNETHATNYFLMGDRGIWSKPQIHQEYTFLRITEFWLPHYAHYSFHALTILSLIWIIYTPNRHSKFMYLLTVLSVIGAFLYILTWFYAFTDHDYYAIDIIIVPVIAWLTIGLYLKKHRNFILRIWYFKLAVVAFVVFNLIQTKSNLEMRHVPDSSYMVHFNPVYYDVDGVRAFFKEINVQRPDRVISIPDRSPNSTLYYQNLSGWTELFNYPFNAEKVKLFASYGAKYLIINDPKYLEKPELKGAFVKPIANYKRQIFVFDIQNLEIEEN